MYVYLRLNNIQSSMFRIIFITYHDVLVIAQHSEDIFSSLAHGLGLHLWPVTFDGNKNRREM